MARTFENKDGDWKKVEKLLKDAKPYVDVIQELANRLAKATAGLEELMLEAYKTAPKVDCLYYDSPVSPNAQTHYLKAYLKKVGWKGVRDIPANTIDVKEFAVEMDQGFKWLTKFKDEQKQ